MIEISIFRGNRCDYLFVSNSAVFPEKFGVKKITAEFEFQHKLLRRQGRSIQFLTHSWHP